MNMLRQALRGLLAAGDRLTKAAQAFMARVRLFAEAVDVAAGVTLIGVPIVQRAAGSRIDIGPGVVLCSTSRGTALGVAHPVVLRTLRPDAKLSIGADTGISGATICAAVSVRIGARCLIGADAMIVDTDFHPLAPEGRRHAGDGAGTASAAVVIGDDVFLGARCVVLKGVNVGAGSVVGCGAVVVSDVPCGSIVAGNPARVVGTVPGGLSKAL